MKRSVTSCLFMLLLLIPGLSFASAMDFYRVVIHNTDIEDRATISEMGLPFDAVDLKTGDAFLTVNEFEFKRLEDAGIFGKIYRLAQPKSMDGYHDETETDSLLTELVTNYPDLVSRFSLGTTYEGRNIDCLRISDNPETDEGEPALFLIGRHHAREPISTELALETAQRLLEGYETDPYVQYLVDEREIYIVPRLNADGAAYDEEQGFVYWRKNRRANPGQSLDCYGVDPNRNYGYEWGGNYGSSPDPCDAIYRGESAFSEPETQAVRDFLLAHENATMVIGLHNFSELILYPWGYTTQMVADETDRKIFMKTAAHFVEYTGYQACPASMLYPTTGALDDWAYGAAGRYSFTFELSPDYNYGDFYIPDSMFEKVFEDNWPAMIMAAGISLDPEMVLSAGLWQLSGEITDPEKAEVRLSWAPIVETDGFGYDILRATNPDGPFEKINETIISLGADSYEYTDTVIPTDFEDVTYYYKVFFDSAVELDQEFGPVEILVEALEPADDDDDTSAGDDDDNDDSNSSNGKSSESDDDDDDDSGCCG